MSNECDTVLVATVGTGGAKYPVWKALAYSVRHHQAREVWWLCSEKTKAETLPKVAGLIDLPPERQQVSVSRDSDNIEELYLEYIEVLDRLRAGRPEAVIVADFTSGTKAMSAALGLAAVARNVQTLAYMVGPRDADGRASVTSHAVSFAPEQIYAEGRFSEALGYFNRGDFTVAQDLAEQVRRRTFNKNKILAKTAETLKGLARAYRCWDLFQYGEALRILKATVARNVLDEACQAAIENQCRYLDVCKNGLTVENGARIDPRWTDHRLVDLYANARRRRDKGNYDDAVARCYRLLEYLAQRQLKMEYGIETDNVPVSEFKPETQEMLGRETRIGLVKSYRLLEVEFDDKMGLAFRKDYVAGGMWDEPRGPLSGALTARNCSLLAHGFEPCTRKAAETILDVVQAWFRQWLPDFDDMIRAATFVNLTQGSFRPVAED